MAPPKRAPGGLGTVGAIGSRFRVRVGLNGINATGPLRTREADARADLAFLRACQTSDEILAFLGLLRAQAAYSNARSHSNARAYRNAVLRRKRAPGELGSVAPNHNRFRVQVLLNGITGTGPLRTREVDAHADLALVRACQTREEIPAFLALLRAEAAYINARPSRPEAHMALAASRRKRAVDGASGPSSAEAGMAPAKLSPGKVQRQAGDDRTGAHLVF